MAKVHETAEYELAVIGGGPAGSAAAILLAKAGKQVCLLERKKTPHHKVCGEFISWEAVNYLRELDIDVAALGAQPIRRVRLYNGEDMLESVLPFTARSLSRRRLDAALLQRAEHAGVRVQLGVAIRGLSATDKGWALDTSEQSRPVTRQSALVADTVFLANGKHDLHNWRRQGQRSPDLIGLKMHLRLNTAQQKHLGENVEVYLFDHGYAGLEPVEDGVTNLCFLISKDVYTACGRNWPGVLAWLGSTSSQLKTRLSGAASLWPQPLAVYGTPYGYLHNPASGVPSLFRLGDQVAVIPSFAGDGIAMALHSAFLAARGHTAGRSSNDYARRARKDFQQPVRDAQCLAGLVSHAWGRRMAFQCARHWPGLLTKVVSRIRFAGS